MRIYAPAAGLNVKLKLEDANDNTHTVETDVSTTVAGWQTLTFDFANQTPGTAALNTAFTFNKLTIFPNFSCGSGAPADADFYVGPITFVGADAPSAPPLTPMPVKRMPRCCSSHTCQSWRFVISQKPCASEKS